MKFNNALLIYLLIIVNTQLGLTQNLVPNPSFEEFSIKPLGPKRNTDKFGVNDWVSQNGGTPDYFNNTVKNKIVSTYNFMGYQEPKTGYSFVGLIIFDNKEFSFYKEAIQTKLKKKLELGTIYCFSMYISLAEKSDYCTNDIGVLFTKNKIEGTSNNLNVSPRDIKLNWNFDIPYKQYTPQILTKSFIEDYDWILIQDTIVAQGGEQYLTIGSFIKETPIKKTKNFGSRGSNHYKNVAYYYIDDVSLVPVSSAEECPCTIKQEEEIPEPPIVEQFLFKDTTVGSRMVLNNIYFALNDSTLLDSSFTELNQLATYMEQHPNLKIELGGHTDDTGSDAYNQSLSEARARAVVTYLEQKGVASKRLTYKGYGRTQPLINETTETARAKNRRVEFLILEK
jgi:outer membrane protein OmpA-like peptidoglycan-associated protein